MIDCTQRNEKATIQLKQYLWVISKIGTYLSTANIREPQVFRYGGVTSHGLSLQHTENVDNALTWLLNYLSNYNELLLFIEASKNKVLKTLMNVFKTFQSGNSADAKKLWFESTSGLKTPITTLCLSFNCVDDIEPLPRMLERSELSKFQLQSRYSGCCSANPAEKKTIPL